MADCVCLTVKICPKPQKKFECNSQKSNQYMSA